MPDDTSRFSFFGAHPHRNMFVTMVAIITAAVLLPEQIIGGRLYDFMVAGILFVALLETARSRRRTLVALAVGVPAIAVRLYFSYVEDSAASNVTVLALSAVFLAFLIWAFLRDLLAGERDTSERVFAALTAYLCIGLLFALIYAHIYFRDPSAFRVPDGLVPTGGGSESLTVPSFTYFSFVTLTTLGYGDFVPLSEQARSLAWLEAIIGQLYLAVMVGGLVGVFFAEATKQAGRATFHAGQEDDTESLKDE